MRKAPTSNVSVYRVAVSIDAPCNQGCARTRDESPNRPCVFEDRARSRAVPWTVRRSFLGPGSLTHTAASARRGLLRLRICGSPIGGRHGHARSETRSSNADWFLKPGSHPGSFHGSSGAAWPCRPPASPMRSGTAEGHQGCARTRHESPTVHGFEPVSM